MNWLWIMVPELAELAIYAAVDETTAAKKKKKKKFRAGCHVFDSGVSC